MLVDYVRVYQTAPAFVLNTWNTTVPDGAGAYPISFTTTDQTVPWTASVNNASANPWVTINAPAAGQGNGTVSFSVTANPYAGHRTAVLTIAGQTFFFTQHGTLQ